MLKSVPTSKATAQPSPGYRSMLVFLCALALVVLMGCAGGGASVPSARATACIGAIALGVSGCQQSQISPPAKTHTSFCIHVARAWEISLAPDPTDLRAAKFDCARIDFHSGHTAPYIARARAIGLGVVAILDHPTPADLIDPTAYVAIVTAGMKQFPGQSWELVNEPDQGDVGYPLSPAQYVTFFKTVIPQMRAADPTAKIISGGVVGKGGNRPTWLNDVHDIWPLVDEIGLHPYPPPWLPNPIPTLPSLLQSISQMTGKPAVVTEWGLAQQFAPLKPGDPLSNPLTQAQAALDVAQMVPTVDGLTPLFVVYEWDNRDDPWAATEGFGIVGTPELAAFTSARGLLAAAPIH